MPRNGERVRRMALGLNERSARTAQNQMAACFVAAVVASAFRIRPEAMRDAHRGPARVAFARQVAIYLSHTRLGLTYAAAGSVFGRDRTTAAHACRTVEDKREDPTLDAILDCLERAVDVWPFAAGGRRGGS